MYVYISFFADIYSHAQKLPVGSEYPAEGFCAFAIVAEYKRTAGSKNDKQNKSG